MTNENLIDFLGKSLEMRSKKKYHNFTWILQHQFKKLQKK